MKILIVTQYFWPENFKINDIALGLKECGHDIEIITGKPNYPSGRYLHGYTFWNKSVEFWNGIKINRSFLIPRGTGKGVQLFCNYFSFAFFGSLRILLIKNKFDKIIVFQPSPITVGIPAIIAKYKFRAPIYFWVQDLWPASLTAAGGITNKYILIFFNKLTKFFYRHSTKILIQSRAFIPYITQQNISIEKLVYYPNTTEKFYQCKNINLELLSTMPNGFKIMFAGNIGEAQSFDTLLTTARLLKNEFIHVNWLILGDGRLKKYVEEKIIEFGLENNFHLLGSHPSYLMADYFSCADVLLVSLKKDPIFSLTIPSKIQSYLACGKPIIASLNGEGARIIEEAQAGFTTQAEDPIELKLAITKATSLTKFELLELGKNARAFYEAEFERDQLIKKLELILK